MQMYHHFTGELAWWVTRFLLPTHQIQLNGLIRQELALAAPRLLIAELAEALEIC